MSAVWGLTDGEIVRVAERRQVTVGRSGGRVPGAIALTLGTLLTAGLLEARLGSLPEVVPASREAPIPARFDPALLDPRPAVGLMPLPFGQSPPLQPGLVSTSPDFLPAPVDAVVVEPVPPPAAAVTLRDTVEEEDATIPLPVARPPDLRLPAAPMPVRLAGRRPARLNVAPPITPPDNRTFFEKLFGLSSRPSGPALAYAPPDGGLFGGGQGFSTAPSRSAGTGTAVYDIASHTVTMPDGARLEAHSGLGDLLDDPRHVAQRNRGATPPHVYDLEPRGQLFHGVQALRLNPVGGGGVFGRTGLLAHSYMLGPNGQSNGCVSFREYDRFLQAFLKGDIKRLVVVGG